MPGRYWGGTIDGIPLLDGADVAGFELIGAEAFDMGAVTSNFTRAADGYPHELSTPLYLYGHELELRFLHAPASLLRALVDAIKARKAVGEGFACTFSDGFQTIEANFKASTEWFSRGEPDGDYIKDAVLRLISIGA